MAVLAVVVVGPIVALGVLLRLARGGRGAAAAAQGMFQVAVEQVVAALAVTGLSS